MRTNLRSIVITPFLIFSFTPHPAEYGAEEFSLDAVPTLGLVRIGPV